MFVIKTDQVNIKFMLEQRLSTPLQHTWLAKLLGYDYAIMYKKGSKNIVVDALSRVTGAELVTMTLSIVSTGLFDSINHNWEIDQDCIKLIQMIEQGEGPSCFAVVGCLLKRKGKLVDEQDKELQ